MPDSILAEKIQLSPICKWTVSTEKYNNIIITEIKLNNLKLWVVLFESKFVIFGTIK